MLLNPRRTRTNMKLLQLVWIFLLTLCGQSAVINIHVKEDDEAILDCSFGDKDIEKKAFDWTKDEDKNKMDVFWYSDGDTDPGPQFKGRVFHFPDQLRFGNASIKITKTKTSDSGTYTCYNATIQKDIKSTISLTVDPILKSRPEIKGASPKPSVELLAQTKDSALLQCEVLGAFPKPEVVWTDSSGKILPADEPKVTKREGKKYDTVLRITVTETDNYTCVATQRNISHQINSTTFVRFNGAASEPSVTILEGTKDGVLLQCIIRGASPELKVSWKNKAGQEVPSKEQKTENSIILLTTVTKTDYYRCVTTEGKKDDEVYSEIRVKISDAAAIGVGTVVIVALITAVVTAVVVGILAFVIVRRSKSNTKGSTTDRSKKNGYDSTEQTSDD